MRKGQGELAGTLVLTVKLQLLKFVYFWKFDSKFNFKSIELAKQISIFNQQDQNREPFVYIPSSIFQRD
jgi:hypothetical protein